MGVRFPSIMNEGWHSRLKPAFENMPQRIKDTLAIKNGKLCPQPQKVFAAFDRKPSDIRVVIVGQSPYPSRKVATGKAFAVPPGAGLTPSLKTISRDIVDKLGYPVDFLDPTLSDWEMQGTMLLNYSLTTIEGHTNSHKAVWETRIHDSPWIHSLIYLVARTHPHPLIWLLLGADAKMLKHVIKQGDSQHVVFSATHPAAEKYGTKFEFNWQAFSDRYREFWGNEFSFGLPF